MKYFGLLLFFIFSSLLKSQTPTDYLNIPGPIDLNETEYLLDWSKKQSGTLYLQQYLPRDEKIENFNQMLNFSYFDKDIDLEEAVRQKVESFQKRSKEDRYASAQVTESPDGNEFIVDGYLTYKTKAGQDYAEYGIYRFKKYTEADKKSFLIFSYIKRIYGDQKYGVKALQKERNDLMSTLIAYTIPPIKLAQQTAETK